MNMILGVIFLVSIIVIFIGISYLNSKTPAPDIEIDLSGCQGCRSISCGHHPTRKIKEEA